jgi:hypothetical protein
LSRTSRAKPPSLFSSFQLIARGDQPGRDDVRLHKTLRVTSAMAAGVADRLWEIGDIVVLVEAAEAEQPRKRGPYKKKAAVSE